MLFTPIFRAVDYLRASVRRPEMQAAQRIPSPQGENHKEVVMSGFWTRMETYLEGEIKTHFAPMLGQFKSKMGPAVIAAAEETVQEVLGAATGQGLTMAQLPAAVEATAKKLAEQGVSVGEPMIIAALQASAMSAGTSTSTGDAGNG